MVYRGVLGGSRGLRGAEKNAENAAESTCRRLERRG